IRGGTVRLCAPLSAEDCAVQSFPDASPAKWHLAHTSWFFETFVLRPARPRVRPFRPEFAVLFNSYYHTVGTMHPRPQRGLLTRPDLETVRAYREHVDRRIAELLTESPRPPEALLETLVLGLHHEQQHQELVLTDIKHLFAQNPLHPVYADRERNA